jgi:nicotinamide mononucleotide transporter
MNYWDWIALITGVLGVVLTIKQKIIAWPISLVSVIISIIAFYKAKLFGDMFLNIFYFFSGIYGWYIWEKKKTSEFNVTCIPKKMALMMLVLTTVQFIIYFFILTYFKSDQIVLDALLTASSFTCTFMMTKKWVENWVFWVIIDLSYVFLYIIKEMPAYALLYFIFAGIAGYGYYTWRIELKKLPS